MVWVLWSISWGLAALCFALPTEVWHSADRNRAFWVTLLVLLGPIGAVVFLVGAAPSLLRARSELSGQANPTQHNSDGPLFRDK